MSEINRVQRDAVVTFENHPGIFRVVNTLGLVIFQRFDQSGFQIFTFEQISKFIEEGLITIEQSPFDVEQSVIAIEYKLRDSTWYAHSIPYPDGQIAIMEVTQLELWGNMYVFGIRDDGRMLVATHALTFEEFNVLDVVPRVEGVSIPYTLTSEAVLPGDAGPIINKDLVQVWLSIAHFLLHYPEGVPQI